MTEQITTEQIRAKFEAKEITGFETSKGKFRLFIATNHNNILCYYAKGSSRRGYALMEYHLEGFKKFLEIKKGGETEDMQIYKGIFKYRKYAEKATFTNGFIETCLSIPKTFNDWLSDGKKSLYQLGVTSGNKIDGQVITIKSIRERYPYIANAFQSAFNGGFHYNSGRFDFRGYEATISAEIKDNGDVWGYLSLEYKGCGNGYYYTLINDECFIGVDVD